MSKPKFKSHSDSGSLLDQATAELEEMRRRADAYPKLVELVRHMEKALHAPSESFRAYKLLSDLGELE